VLDEEEAAAALTVLERLLGSVEAGELTGSPAQRERLAGAAEAVRLVLTPRPSTNQDFH